jgi:hypothetical protein
MGHFYTMTLADGRRGLFDQMAGIGGHYDAFHGFARMVAVLPALDGWMP